MKQLITTSYWIDAEIAKNAIAAKARATKSRAKNPYAIQAHFDTKEKRVNIALSNGVHFSFPVALAQGLAKAKTSDLAVIELSPSGSGLHWPKLDADFSVSGLLAGVFGSRMWMKEIAALSGQQTSIAKAQASRANGAKGGRPKKAIFHG